MTLEEYKNRLAELTKEFNRRKNTIAREYAISNNPYKVGDILQDHCQIIKVEQIKWAFNFKGDSQCVYYGTHLTQKLEPKKKQDNSCMYQDNVIRKLN